MQNEASVLSSVSKSTQRNYASGLDRSQAEASHLSSSADVYEKYVFSIVAEANRSKKVQPIIRLIEYFFIFAQLLLSSYNDFIPYEDTNKGYVTFLKVFYIGFIGSADDTIPFMIAVSIVDLITVLFFGICVIDFHVTHEYRKWMLYILRVWHGHLYGIFLIPNFLMIMKGFAYLGLHNDALGFIIVILTSIFGCISIWHYLIILPFFSRSPYLSPSPVHAWNVKKIYKYLLISSIPMGLESFLNDQFEEWIETIPLFLMIAIFIYLIYELCSLPFKGIFFNALTFGCFNGVILGAIFSAVEAVSEGVSEFVFYGCPIFLAVASTIAIYFVIRSYRKKIVKLLNYSSFNEPGVRPTEEMKKLHLTEMDIKNKKKGIMFIQIGFEGMCDMFVDWSLCKFLFESFPTDDDLIAYMSWLASLFPSEIQFLHKLITHGTKIVGISIDNRCLFYQIHRIHIFRQSSTSRETSNDFNKVKMITDQTISAFCKYWLNLAKPNNEFKTSIYQGLANQKKQAEAAWSEALDKYPNNPRFAQEHAIYLLEVGCQFRESIKQNQNAQQLENGLRMQNDKTFHHFVLSYPCYLKSGVVDTKGNLKGPQIEKIKSNANETQNSLMSSTRKTISKSSSTNINSDSSDDSSSDQIDLQEGARFLPQMNLRLALQRAINGLKAGIIERIIVSAAARAILTVIFIVICVLISKPIFNNRIDLFNVYYGLNKIEHTYALASNQFPWLMHQAIFDSKPNYTKFLDEVSSLYDPTKDTDNRYIDKKYMQIFDQFEYQVNITKPIRETINEIALNCLNFMNEFNLLFYSIDAETDKRLHDIKKYYYQTKTTCVTCVTNATNPNQSINTIYRPDIWTIDYAFRTVVLELRLLTLDPDPVIKFWGTNSTDFCDMFANSNQLSNYIKQLSVSTSATLYDIYYQDFITSHSLSNKKLLSDAKENRKKRLYQTMIDLIADHPNADISIESIDEKFNNPQFIDMIEEDVENDFKLYKSHKKKQNKAKIVGENENNKKLTLLESIKLKNEIIYNKSIHDQKLKQVLEDDGDDGEEGEEEEENQMTDNADEISTICNFIIAFSPFILCLFILPSIIYLKDGLEYEMTSYSNVLRNLPKADCLKAGERIKPIEYKENQVKGKNKTQKKHNAHLTADASAASQYPFWLFDVVSALIIIVFLIVFAIIAESTKNKIEDYIQYYSLFIAQRNCIYNLNKDVLISLLFIQCSVEPELKHLQLGTTPQTNPYYAFLSAIQDISRYQSIKQAIDAGDEKNGVKSSILGDSILNKIRFDPICSDKPTTNIPIDYYKCLSLERTMSYFIELIISCVTVYKSSNKPLYLSTSVAPYLIHMLDTRVAVGFTEIAERLRIIFEAKIKLFDTLLIVIPIISIIFTLITFSMEMLLLVSVSNQFHVFKSLILRINPISFVANNQLISLVYGKNDKVSQIVSASHAVFTTSPDAMISLNNEGVIEYLNPSTTTIFGYTPEQMLGQHIQLLLNVESKERQQLFYQMQLMQSGQTSLIYECELKGTRDDGSAIYLKVTLIGFSSSSNNRIAETFGMMCRDMTNEIKQKNAVEEAKKQSEQLLLQILPKDIIMRLNRGDTDISFTVQSSTIAFIDIEKFSNYSASLSASEIMQNLGLVFTAYDQLLAKYSLIIKIKLIGDDYMLAAGLFNQEVEPPQHATQVVNFTLECLDAIEDLNEQLNASLQVRIGVNSGGPLIAGVLGTDKPLFDIIGDPINVASRLQSTDIPGFVQISQQTYDYVAGNNDFHIEQRGEVELKGKGKQMTYLVHPHQRDNVHKGLDEDSQGSIDLPSSDHGQIDEDHK